MTSMIKKPKKTTGVTLDERLVQRIDHARIPPRRGRIVSRSEFISTVVAEFLDRGYPYPQEKA